MTASHRHHYVSQFYLKHFAADRTDPWLYTVDLPTQKTLKLRPQNVAFENDFHTINAPGQSPDVVEKELAKLEGDVAPALDRLIENLGFTSGADREHVLFFLTMLLIKSPAMRRTIDKSVHEIMSFIGKTRAQDPAAFAVRLREHIADGTMPADTDIEQLRQNVLSDDLTIGLSTEAHLQLEFSLLPKIYADLVAPRRWNILRAAEGQFVTSDRPVVGLWADADIREPVALGHPKSRILFPLSSEVAMCGGVELEDCTFDIGRDDVAKTNGRIILSAKRQIYARDEQFEYLLRYHAGRAPGSDLAHDELAIAAVADN